jgi:DNA polymerase
MRKIESCSRRVEMLAGELEKLNKQIDACKSCPLCSLPVNDSQNGDVYGKLFLSVFESSNPKAKKILFIGIAPSYRRFDPKRRAFTPGSDSEDSSGKFFFDALREVGLFNHSLYFTNLIHCSTEDNRYPRSEEVKACSPFLKMEIDLVKPDLIVCLSKNVYDDFLRVFRFHILISKLKVVYIKHPSYFYRKSDLNELKGELLKIKNMVEEVSS